MKLDGVKDEYHRPDFKISSSTLKSFEVLNCKKIIEVVAVNLESFGFGLTPAHGSNREAKYLMRRIRKIDLFNSSLEGAWFQGLDSRFPLLDSLLLNNCHIWRSR